MKLCRWVVLALLLATPIWGQEAKKADPPAKPVLPEGTPKEQFGKLKKQFEDARTKFFAEYRAAKTDMERQAVLGQQPDSNAYAEWMVQIAEKNPKDETAFDCLLWAFQNSFGREPESARIKAKNALVKDHINNPRIGSMCMRMRHDFTESETVDTFRKILTQSKDPGSRAQASYCLAYTLRGRANWSEMFKDPEKKMDVSRFAKAYGKQNIEDLLKVDAAALRKESEELLDAVVKDKQMAEAEIDWGSKKRKLGEVAGAFLFEIRHLQPGQPAPEITGEDIYGKPMKLSDFRGKVVLLDFWGHW